MGDAIAHLATAINNHDLEAFVALFAADYRSEQPAHPSRSFRGVETRDGVEVGEWHWYGKHVDGSEFAMRGVIVLGMDSSREAAAAVDHEALAGDIARRL
ncbi:MAG TPA: hypothetical protein VFB94_24845 [Acidimicrobiales bacterium]|nr:hypothetical protein [Acidimicrobiales bacterium]